MANLYIPHDFSACSDMKIVNMRMELGWEGYGLFWAIIELLCSSSNHRLDTNFNALAYNLRADAGKVKKVVCDYGLFILAEDGGSFYSERLSRQFDELDQQRKRRSEAGKKGNEKRWGGKNQPIKNDLSQCDDFLSQCDSNAIKVTDLSQCDKFPSQCDSNATEIHRKCIADRRFCDKNSSQLINKLINTSAVAELDSTHAREENSATATAGENCDVWTFQDNPFTPAVLELCDEFAEKFRLVDGRVYAPQLVKLLSEVHRPGVVDGIQVVRDGLKRLDTAKAVTSGRVKITPTRFLRSDIFLRLINGDYDEDYRQSGGGRNRFSQAGLSFEGLSY